MELYGAIDLHGKNNVLVIMGGKKKHLEKRMPNDLDYVLKELKPYREDLTGIAVESTYNWYWLVDGLMEEGYKVHLTNTSAVKQYEGLKYTDDRHDARWLAQMLQLGILPVGYIYPKEERAARDLLRKRSSFVRQRTANILSIKNLIARNTGRTISANKVKQLTDEDVERMFENQDHAMAIKSSLHVMWSLDEEIKSIEKRVKEVASLRPEYRHLLTVPGIGEILAMTISLETGDIGRFRKPGNYVSYCRGAKSTKLSDGKKKGKGNRKNGNKYLSWAYIEAATHCMQWSESARKYYQRKSARSNAIVARKSLAAKLTRACYYIMRDQIPFDPKKMFGF